MINRKSESKVHIFLGIPYKYAFMKVNFIIKLFGLNVNDIARKTSEIKKVSSYANNFPGYQTKQTPMVS